MCIRNNIEAIDRTLKQLMRSNMSFGGRVILFCGDFRQVLPIIQCGSKARVLVSCFKRSPLFLLLKVLRLRTNMKILALQQNADANEVALAFQNFYWT